MKIRRRKSSRRRRFAPSATPTQIPPPHDLATEIEQSVEARDRLESLADRATAERDKSEPDFLRLFASEMRVVELDAGRALERWASWRAQDALAAQRSDALRQLSIMFKE